MRRAWLVLLLPALMGAKCGESLIADPGFDLWCGDTLCDWTVDAGTIAKTPTWHERDYGVELDGTNVQLSQRGQYGDDRPGCLEIDLLSDVAAGPSVTLQMDFGDDGSAEFSQVLPIGAWQTLSYKVTAPTWYSNIRFTITKRGDGHAVLARIRVAAAIDCNGPPLSTVNRPGGVPCESPAQCSGGGCRPEGANETLVLENVSSESLCSSCAADQECGAGVCGLTFGDATTHPFRACVAAGAHRLGERCAADGECSTGVCCQGTCSTCCTDKPCAGAATCARIGAAMAWQRLPWQCGGAGISGAWCLADADCASGGCMGDGQLSVCAVDGRPCDATHPCHDYGDRLPNACTALGVAGGRCR